MREMKRIQETSIWDVDMSMLRIPAAIASGLRKWLTF